MTENENKCPDCPKKYIEKHEGNIDRIAALKRKLDALCQRFDKFIDEYKHYRETHHDFAADEIQKQLAWKAAVEKEIMQSKLDLKGEIGDTKDELSTKIIDTKDALSTEIINVKQGQTKAIIWILGSILIGIVVQLVAIVKG